MKNARGRLVTVAALIAAGGLTLAGTGTGTGTGTGIAYNSTPTTGVPSAMPPHPAIIRTGTCDVPGQVVFPLDAVRMVGPAAHELAESGTPAVESGTSDVGQPDAIRTNLPVNPSTALRRTPLADLLTATRAITIYWSEHDIPPAPIACGEIDGAPVGLDVTVPVTLTEFRIAVLEPALRVNQRYTFAGTNDGTLPHELVTERAGAVPEPLTEAGGEAMIHEIAPGETATLT